MDVFVVCTADDQNIGDVVLRRSLLRAVSSDQDTVHAYVGGSESGFVAAMAYGTANFVSYTDLRAWTKALRSRAGGGVAFFAKPGEMVLGLRPFVRQALSAWHAQLARGAGIAVLAGCGFRSAPPVPWLYRAFLSGYDHLAWRDSESARYLGVGREMPDWAFARSALLEGGGAAAARTRLTIALRGSTAPSAEWLRSVADFARGASLAPTVIVQVRHDQELGKVIAGQLDTEFIGWGAQSHLEQERRVRGIFSQSAIVLSNRLHALIMGMTEGAVPLCAIESSDRKVQRHFNVVGLQNVVHRITSAAEMSEALAYAATRQDAVSAAMARALEATDREIAEIKQMMKA